MNEQPKRSLFDRLVEQTGQKAGGNSRIGELLWQRGVADSRELRRVLNLPRREIDLAKVPDLTPLFQVDVGGCRGCELCADGPPRLWPRQSLGLIEAEQHRGLLGAIPVGGGKTLLSLLLADALNARMAVLLVPPSVRDQLLKVDIPRLRRHFRLPLERLRVVAYSQLSDARSARVLDEIAPDVIIADEAHSLKAKSAARTKRFRRYMVANPGTIFIPLSGTMTTKSIRDYAHLAECALRAGSPVPNTWPDVEEWSAALDVRKEDDEPMPPGALLKFCEESELTAYPNEVEAARVGYQRRLRQTPGVIVAHGDELGTSLVIRARRPAVPAAVREALARLHNTWSIGEEELEDPMAFARAARQVSFGFYYRWDWSFRGGDPDEEWLAARRLWHRSIRDFLQHRAKPGMDSPLLVARACSRRELPMLDGAWQQWDAVRTRRTPPTIPVWIDKFAVQNMVDWAAEKLAEGRGGIIWYEHAAIEAELAKVPEMPVFGSGMNEQLLAASAACVVAASVRAHGTGKNLQRWHTALFAIAPANATTWQQAIAREHRHGQEADEVEVDVMLHTNDLEEAFKLSLAGARYVEQTTGEKQRLLFARKEGWE